MTQPNVSVEGTRIEITGTADEVVEMACASDPSFGFMALGVIATMVEGGIDKADLLMPEDGKLADTGKRPARLVVDQSENRLCIEFCDTAEA